MKKLGLLVMPLMVISFLASCGGSNPEPTPTVIHNLTYIYDNGTDKSFTEKYIDDEKTKEPTWTPTYDGHTFVGWYKEAGEGEEGTEFTFGGALTDNETIIHAHWNTNPPEPGITHNIYLDPCGGAFGQDQKEVIKVVHNTAVEKAPVVTREGYEAPTWWYETDDGTAEFKFGTDGTLVTKDYFLHADWGEEHPSKYSVSFIGDDCTGKTRTMTTGVSEFQTYILYDDFDNVTITVNPKTDFHLLTTEITVLKDGVKTTSQGDYTYVVNDDVGTVTLKSKGDFLVKIKATSDTPAETHTVTLDANGGSYITGSTYSFDVKKGDNLSKNIKAIVFPCLSGKTFAYYTYSDGTAIDYDDTVTSDVELKANYFDIAAPLTDLDSPKNISWKEIKAVATTNGNPNFCFKIGATKKVNVNTKTHTVRIIGFNHDYSELPDDSSSPDPNKVLGITFEFANVITDSNGEAITTTWNGEYQVGGNNYDYRKSVLNNFLNNDVLNMLPSSSDPNNPDLKEVIKPVDKKVGVYSDSNGTYTATSFDGSDDYPYPYLFSLAHDEITSETSTVVPANEGKRYQYYIDHPNEGDRIKRKAGIDSENGEYYWLRSPYTGSSSDAWYVYDDGILYSYYVYGDADAVAPAFCI